MNHERNPSIPLPGSLPPPPQSTQRRCGALLVHGLGGTEYDMGRLRASLEESGIDAHVVALPGHGTRPEDLVGIRAEDWMDAVMAAYRRLSERYRVLHVVGVCLGALLAIEACKRTGHAKGKLVVLAAPLDVDGWNMPWYRAIRHVLYRLPAVARRWRVYEQEPYGIKNERIRRLVRGMLSRGDAFHYPWVPLSSVREADRLRAMVWRELDRLQCRSKIMHATEDELTSPESARALHRRVKGSVLRLLDNSYHMICVDNERGHVMHSVKHFLADPACEPAAVVAAPCPQGPFGRRAPSLMPS